VNKNNNELEPAGLRHDWTAQEIEAMLLMPLTDLVYRAQTVHRQHHPEKTVQLSSLLSIKTGGCKEDCSYCSQSAHHMKKTKLVFEPLMPLGEVLAKARQAKEAGATRFCMGAAWREVREGEEFERVIRMVEEVNAVGLETCVTLGMLNEYQAKRLKEAGLAYYNHNLDTSPEFYGEIVTTRSYQDRLDTIQHVQQAGISVCSGGIIGMGETLAIEGTPLADKDLPEVDPLDVVRMIAAARITMPASEVRLSAGRHKMSREAQILCLMAGANSIFYGDRLLTTENAEANDDLALIREAGLEVERAH